MSNGARCPKSGKQASSELSESSSRNQLWRVRVRHGRLEISEREALNGGCG